jgi:hypothetical protein
MAVAKMLISPDIKDKLGDDGVSEVSGWLWPRDCQTCGRKLGARPPALCVDDVITFALASLHHQQCRAPAWAPGLAGFPPGDMITHGTRLMLLPTDGNPIPVMLLNPSMEVVMLAEHDGRWRPQFHAPFTSAGMVPPGPELQIYKPVKGVTGLLTAAGVTITMPPPSITDSYECGLARGDGPVRREIASRGGVLLAVTHAVDPFSSDRDLPGQLADAFRSQNMVCGWVPPSGA